MGQWGWLAWLIVGGLAGLSANSVMPSRMGLIADLIIGFLGALAAGYLFDLTRQPGIIGFDMSCIFVAFLGAVSLLGGIRLGSGNRRIAY